jgi:hypothetical protein
MKFDNMNNTNLTKTSKKQGRTQVLGKSGQFLFHMWHLLCYSYYEPGDKSLMRKGLDCDYYKRNISVVICDTNTL